MSGPAVLFSWFSGHRCPVQWSTILVSSLATGLLSAQRNKCRQVGPAGPDRQTASRFHGRCGKRYVPLASSCNR